MLQGLGIVFSIATYSLFVNSCERSVGEKPGSICDGDELKEDVYSLAAAAMALVVVIGSIQLAISVYGLLALNKFDATNLKRFFVLVAVALVIQIVLNLINVGSPDSGSVASALLGALLSALLGGWYVWAVKILSERIQNGEITAENPTGHRDYNQASMEMGQRQQGNPPPYAANPQAMQPAVAYAVATSVPAQPQVVQGTVVQPAAAKS